MRSINYQQTPALLQTPQLPELQHFPLQHGCSTKPIWFVLARDFWRHVIFVGPQLLTVTASDNLLMFAFLSWMCVSLQQCQEKPNTLFCHTGKSWTAKFWNISHSMACSSLLWSYSLPRSLHGNVSWKSSKCDVAALRSRFWAQSHQGKSRWKSTKLLWICPGRI